MISEAGIRLVKEHEGLVLEAYPDPATGKEPFTIGYGHAGPEVKLGMEITQAEADEYLKEDLAKAEECIDAFLDEPEKLTQSMRDALASFIFNVGCGNFKASTLRQLILAGNYSAAAKQFSRWCHAGGRTMPGLVARREDEAQLFMEA